MVRCQRQAVLMLVLIWAPVARAETIFIEAETFKPSSDGWCIIRNDQTAKASRVTTLHGADGAPDGTAAKAVVIKEAGRYRIWVRYLQVGTWRGAFHLAALAAGKEVAGKDFDVKADPDVPDWDYVWKFFEADLQPGAIILKLSKYKNENCTGYVRHVDCVFLTTDKNQVPEVVPYGPQSFVRVTLGNAYSKPVYIHIFADHYRGPWYGHHYLARDGCQDALEPSPQFMMKNGERTPWCNISRMVYQDSGAILNISPRFHYHEKAQRLLAKFEFASAPDEKAVVKTFDADCTPAGMVVVMPPDLLTKENRARLGRDLDYAGRIGKQADAFHWPAIGKKPEQFPFLVTASLGGYELAVDQKVTDREQKTLDYFGFSNDKKTIIGGGAWRMKDNSYCQPDVAAIKLAATNEAAAFKTSGKTLADIAFCMLMDEPTGQDDTFMARDPGYLEHFRGWLQVLGKKPADLGVGDWQAVKPVVEAKRDRLPVLYYFTQRFRTRALGNFLAVQKDALEKALAARFPAGVNFSDGAIYYANFYAQGVDYFELLDDSRQNAIWGEDWGNLSSTYQCTSFNVDLMRAAARKHGQRIGQYLIAHAGRKPWDIKLKAASEVARGVKIFQSYYYGTTWGSHEGGPAWASSSWQGHPEKWFANAEIVREIGGAEDLLVPAMPPRAEVAILYTSSTDIWTLNRNHAFGLDRMHTWLALAHAQVPADLLSEKQVEEGGLASYKVCYLSGPNLTIAAAARLRAWVNAGGTLWMTAEAASRDEFNRPLQVLDDILPARRKDAGRKDPWIYSGFHLHLFQPQDLVTMNQAEMEVLSIKESLTPRSGARAVAYFKDGTPALVVARCGKGSVYAAGFLPALAYIKSAEVARQGLLKRQLKASKNKAVLTAEERAELSLLEVSDNPWKFSPAIRDFILQPLRGAAVKTGVKCSVPLVDAVVMTSDRGMVIPLANYTLQPQKEVNLVIHTPRPVRTVESIHHGAIQFEPTAEHEISFSLPLESTDFIKLYFK